MNKLEIHISRRLRDAALCTLFFMLILHATAMCRWAFPMIRWRLRGRMI